MQLGDILVKIATNQKITAQEQEFLRLTGNETQQRNANVSGWISNGLRVNSITTNELKVGKEIYSGLAARYYYDSLSTSNGVYTDIPSWTADYQDYGFYTLNQNVYIPQTGRYQVIIHTWWDINAVGSRDMGTKVNTVANSPWDNQLASTAVTYLNAMDEKQYNAGDAVKLTVRQDSGGTLTMGAAWMVFRKIR